MNKELSKEESEALTKDLNELLERHGVEMSVTTNILFFKREEEKKFEPEPIEDSDDGAQV